jgi:hypothetical protein
MFRALGIVAGAISLSILAWKGFHFGFGPFLLAVLEQIEADYEFFFSFIEPYVQMAVAELRAVLGWNLQLFPHWKHVFVLMWLYFGTNARQVLSSGGWGGAAFRFLWGGAIAISAGVLAGVVALNDASSNMAMAFWPMMGIVVFDFGRDAWSAVYVRNEQYTWAQDFWRRAQFTITRRALPGAILLTIGTQSDSIPILQNIPNRGLALLFAVILALALYYLYRGATAPSKQGVTPWQRFLNTGRTRIALDMLSVIGLAALVVIIGATGL